MKLSYICMIIYCCMPYISDKSNASELLKDENTLIQPAAETFNANREVLSKPDNENFIAIQDDNSVLHLSDTASNTGIEEMSNAENVKITAMKYTNFVPQIINRTSNIIIEEMFRTDTEMITAMEDKKFVPQLSDEASKDILEEIYRTDTNNKIMRDGSYKSVRNCIDLKKQGKQSGTYLITPCDDTPAKEVMVFCDMSTDGGGWTVIQRRDKFPGQQQDFNKDWEEYAVGFGNIQKEFWLGNDNIHCLTKQSHNELRIDLEDVRYANYRFFYIDDKENKYKLDVSGFSGDIPDSFTYHNHMFFSTSETDNDIHSGNCGKGFKGGWWFGECFLSYLNGVYGSAIKWNSYSTRYSLQKTEMKIRGVEPCSNPRMCNFEGRSGDCSSFTMQGRENVGKADCEDGCDCWMPIIVRAVRCGIENAGQPRIVNGRDVDVIRKYSWHVGLKISGMSQTGQYFCGGSIISDKHVLTAAHCVCDKTNKFIMAAIGDHNTNINLDNLNGFEYPILVYSKTSLSKIIVHPYYICGGKNNIYDIAILELSMRINLKAHAGVIHPVCLPANDRDYEDEMAIITGWGSTVGFNPLPQGQNPIKNIPNVLQEGQVKIISNIQCRYQISLLLNPKIKVILDSQMCSENPNGFVAEGQNVCRGDSGGAVSVISNKQHVQIGIVSASEGCAARGYPSTYTRVSKFIGWIKDNIGNEEIYIKP